MLLAADVLGDANVGGGTLGVVNSAGTDFCAQDSAGCILDAVFADFSRSDELLHNLDEVVH